MPTCSKCNEVYECTCHKCSSQVDVSGTTAGCPLKMGSIWVLVKDDTGKGVETIEFTGPGVKKSNDVGFASFDPLPPKVYQVTATIPLPDTVKADFALPEPYTKNADVKVGQVVQVSFQLKRRPTPTISVDAPKIVIVKHDYHGKDKPGVKPHRIAVKLDYTGDHDGVGELSCTPDDVKVFDKEDDPPDQAKAMPWKIKAAELKGKTVYIEGTKASTAVAGTELKLTLKDGTIPPKKDDATEKITCVELKLNIYKARVEDAVDPVIIDEAPKLDPGRAVLVQGSTDKRLWAQRAKLAVAKAKPTDYAGQLVLKPLTDGVEAFAEDQEKPASGQVALTGDALKPANGAIDAAKGKVFWAQGKTLSAKMSDTGWTVELAEVPGKEGDRVTMTVLKAELALYQSRSDAAATVPKPTVFSDDDKFAKGRYIHVQNAGFHHGRAMIVVKKVQPDGFVGTLTLSVWDAVQKPSYSATKSASPKIEVFDDEVAASGQSAKVLPLEIDHPATFPAEGKTFWVQGKTVSTALCDAELRVGVKEVDAGCDRAEFTAVSFSNFKADIPSTAANKNRNRKTGGLPNNPTPRHDFLAGANDAAKHFSDDFTVNLPLPLVEGSIKSGDQVKLSVEIKPSGLDIPVKWSAIRAFDDKAEIKSLAGNSEDPGLHADGSDVLKATMEAKAAGSFRVRAYIDCNGNSKFDERTDATDSYVRIDREPFILMNLVLFRVKCVSNTSAANSTAAKAVVAPNVLTASGMVVNAAGVPQSISTGDFAGTGNDAVDMKAVIQVIGGGPAGLRGLDPATYLFAGWLNNELNCPTAPNPNNWGEDATHHLQRPATAPAPRPLLGLRCYWRLDGVRISGPICDSGGRYRDRRGVGGASCIGTMAGAEPPVNKIADPAGIGQRWTVANSDSPGGPIASTAPSDGLARLVRFTFNLNFQSALLVWTNVLSTPEPASTDTGTGSACCRLYSTVQAQSWTVRFDSTFDASYTETSVTAKTITLTKDADPTRLATPADASGYETRAPGGLNAGQYDQPFDPAHPEAD